MNETSNILELISSITEINDISEYMQDDQLDRGLAAVVKLVSRPDVPAQRAVSLITELQAISAVLKVKKIYYMTIAKDKAGTPNNNKKNIYATVADAIDKLVDVLKYSARYST